MNVTIIFWFLITIIAGSLMMILIKKYADSKSTRQIYCYQIPERYIYTITILLVALVLFLGYSEIVSKYPMHWLFPIWFISMIIILFSGVLLYGQTLKMINVFGIILGLVAIILLVS